jgi:class 3 adenylate cyclase
LTGDGGEAARIRRIRLAHMRQELLAPVAAILGYGEMLDEAARDGGLDDVLPDLERILTAARGLHDMVDRLLDPEAAEGLFEGKGTDEVQKILRHDLRTPLNAIKGYGEMLLEDLEDMGASGLEADFGALISEADRLLAQLDGVVDFSGAATEEPREAAEEAEQSAAMFAHIAESIRPVREAGSETAETGKILVVDDLESNRDVLSRRLTRDGHRVEVAAGGREALRKIASEDFDLVLLDLMMPDMNGFEVLARLKADDRLHETPVIMVSALDEMDSVIRCIEAGAEDYLPKPFNPTLLKARISACLERRRWQERERAYLDRLEIEKEKYEALLLNILPQQIIGRLNDGETIIADRFDNVSVLFSDLVGFTELSSRLPPNQLVGQLNRLFSSFDRLAKELGVEKIKTIGDAYMVVSGIPDPRRDHAEAIARTALGMLDIVERANLSTEHPVLIRIGIHSGPVVAGVIGTHKFIYDVWGDTVNVASRLESHGLPNHVQVSKATARLLDDRFDLERRGLVTVKGKGRLETFFLNGAKETSAVPR